MAGALDIRFHYDDEISLFQSMLGPSMMYSCANWSRGDSLEHAQLRKIRLHLANMEINSGDESMVDLGCGWGGFAKVAKNLYPNLKIQGLTLSPVQADFAHNTFVDSQSVRFSVEDIMSFERHEPFDAGVCIGAFEHLSSPKEWRKGIHRERYERFFENASRQIDGCLSLQTIYCAKSYRETKDPRQISFIKFMYDHIFPNALIPPLADILESSGRSYKIEDMRITADDYAQTLNAWRNNLRASDRSLNNLPQAEIYDRYLSLCIQQFELGYLGLCQLKLRPKRRFQ